MTEPDQRALDVIGGIAARRAAGWRALAAGFGPPTAETVIALRAGTPRATIVHATEWLDSDRERFTPGLDLLDACGRAASALTLDDAVGQLSTEHTRLFADPDHLLAQLAESAALAERERDLWLSGDAAQAKALRVVQREYLLAHQARSVPALCAAVTAAARLDLYRAWASVLLGYLSVEAGVDYARTELSTRFPPTR